MTVLVLEPEEPEQTGEEILAHPSSPWKWDEIAVFRPFDPCGVCGIWCICGASDDGQAEESREP